MTRRDSANPGVMALAVHDLFRQLAACQKECMVRVGYVEIYNENLRDLLAGPEQAGEPLRITNSRTFGVVLQGLHERYVTSPEEVLAVSAPKAHPARNQKRRVVTEKTPGVM